MHQTKKSLTPTALCLQRDDWHTCLILRSWKHAALEFCPGQYKITTDFLITHRFSFDNIKDAYKLFEEKSENCLKVAVEY